MLVKRSGQYGEYYGSASSISSTSLTQSQMELNATYIYKYLTAKGWTKNAIAGMLGNMEAESTLNPGRWQSDDVGNTSGGYGLVQWTPATKYIDWCNDRGYTDYSTMDSNLSRIIYELENNLQWIPTDNYNYSFEQFSKSNASVEILASAFLKNYERAGVEVEETRRTNARKWYEYLNGQSGSDEDDTTHNGVTFKRSSGFNFILFNARKRRIF